MRPSDSYLGFSVGGFTVMLSCSDNSQVDR